MRNRICLRRERRLLTRNFWARRRVTPTLSRRLNSQRTSGIERANVFSARFARFLSESDSFDGSFFAFVRRVSPSSLGPRNFRTTTTNDLRVDVSFSLVVAVCMYRHHHHHADPSPTLLFQSILPHTTGFLNSVMKMERCVVFRRFCGGVGRTAQAKQEGSTNGQGRWPKKCAEILINLLKNAESNAEVKGLDIDNLYITHIQVNKAIPQRRRTYRAHGRINPYMSSPCHVELMLEEKEEPVARAEEPKKYTRRQQAKLRSGIKSN